MAQADLIIVNANILTMDASHPTASALAIGGNLIQAIGSNQEVRRLAGPVTRIVDAQGCSVTPGIVESHVHILMAAGQLDNLDLNAVHGRTELAATIHAYAAQKPELALVYGNGVSYTVLDDAMLPTRHDLDAIIADRPFAMITYDQHTVFANTKALELAGILSGASVPLGSEIVMGADGLATGELREPGAFRYVLALTPTGGRDTIGFTDAAEPDPQPTPIQRAHDRAMLLRGLKHCASMGITSLHNMDGNFYTLELLDEIDKAGDFTCRCNSPFHFKNYFGLERLVDAVRMRDRFHGERTSSGRIKLFMDGVLESWTALNLAPYPDKPESYGEANFTPAQFNALAIEADRLGLQITVHAVGDAAVRQTLDGYAAARAANGVRDSRHRIEHLELIDPADLPRLRDLGVVASLQPTHGPGPVFPLEPANTRIGQARMERAYAWATIRDSGAVLAINSDWPVAPVHPMITTHAAVTRPGPQALTLMQTLAGQTFGGAFAEHLEHRKGSLAPGMLADVVVWSADLTALRGDALRSVTAQLTICDGQITHEAR
jgi:predicted amidohydrolase YtcJ